MKKIILLLFSIFFWGNVAIATDYQNLYLVGSATQAGWDTNKAIEMIMSETGVFSWEGYLSTGTNNNELKFIKARSWAESINAVDGHKHFESETEYNLAYKNTDYKFFVDDAGCYRISVNLNTMKVVFTRLPDVCDIPAKEAYTREIFTSSNGEILNYRKLSPIQPEVGKKYPLVIFMHGAGERGLDNNAQLTHGGELFAKKFNRETYPAYVLFPQCPAQYFWAYEPAPTSYNATTFPVNSVLAPAQRQVKELIDIYLAQEDIDVKRVYITGVSMGGMATFDMVCRFPEIFAAAVPICGGVNTERINPSVKDVYWRIFHGDADGVVPLSNSRTAHSKLMVSGAEVEYIEYPGVNHDVWNNVFEREDFLPWLFEKIKTTTSSSTPLSAQQDAPKAYYKDNTLYVNTQGNGILEISLYSITGQLLHNVIDKNIGDKSVPKQYSLPLLHNGIYLIKIQDGFHQSSLKIFLY
ncbi:MAG: hypothetical protein BGO29_05755 [Bacteroidales bacterium 36-12]|nr:MAG: hypothetical protein BGO29_05755 [Bacteroidales bacterium 36-12]